MSQQVEEEKFYLALKTLDTLKTSLISVPSCRLTRNLEAFIKPQTDLILVVHECVLNLQERSRQSFYKWCREINPVCRMIGEASMIRAFNRKQQEGTVKGSEGGSVQLGIEKEGIEDILEKVDLSIIFEFQHVFEHVGKLPEFKQMYIERREVQNRAIYDIQRQCDFEVMTSKNLKAMSTDQFCELYVL